MVKYRKFIILLLLPLLVSSFLLVSFSLGQVDTSVLSMSGDGWSVKVDGSLKTALDSATTPYIASKSATEKELFLTLNSLKDCVGGKVEFKVNTVGLSVFKQLPLDQDLNKADYSFVNATHALNEKGEVVVYRPQNIVNSFACFDGSGRKVLHISASKLVDAKGETVWVDSDLVNGVLTVYLDAKWLETASFPVVLDPSFGLTTIGASSKYQVADELGGSKYNLAENATVTNIVLYTNSSGFNFKTAIYADSDKSLIISSGAGASASTTWVSLDVNDTFISAGDYWLLYKIDTNTASALSYDTGSTGDSCYRANNYGDAFPDPLGSVTTENLKISIYANYTIEEEPTPTPTPTPTATPTPTPTASPVPSVTPIVNGDLTDTEWFVSALMLVLVVVNIVLIAVPFALVRFVFGALAFSLSALAFTLDQIPLSPYLQIMSMVVSVVCMFLAARARE